MSGRNMGEENPDAYGRFKGTMLDEAVGSGSWIRDPYLDTTNWFPESNEPERYVVAERALRELFEAGLIEIVRDDDRTVSNAELDALFESEVWRSGSDNGPFARTCYRQTPKGRAHYGKPV